jgi:hypothetical protein
VFPQGTLGSFLRGAQGLVFAGVQANRYIGFGDFGLTRQAQEDLAFEQTIVCSAEINAGNMGPALQGATLHRVFSRELHETGIVVRHGLIIRRRIAGHGNRIVVFSGFVVGHGQGCAMHGCGAFSFESEIGRRQQAVCSWFLSKFILRIKQLRVARRDQITDNAACVAGMAE